jgi:DNA-binding NarL/FixJ family response regulator/anti-sigma regulatory factor (Ser/Thr protein kinase)
MYTDVQREDGQHHLRRRLALDDIGLEAALSDYVKRWSRHFGIEAEILSHGMDKERMTDEIESMLYRITQEALTNVAKHAGAENVSVLLEPPDDHVSLIIEDDGRGFDAEQPFAQQEGLGLVGMRERAALVGGTLRIDSEPGRGTTVVTGIPAPPAPAGGRSHMDKLRILLADDHKVVRRGLRLLVGEQSDMEVVGESNNGRKGITLAQQLRPDVVVMDVSMPELNGLKATEKLKGLCPDIKILTLTRHTDSAYLQQLIQAGASGYVLKQSPDEELILAIRAVANGQTYLDPAITGQVIEQITGKREPRGSPAGKNLSPREEEVLRLIAQGYIHKEIADRLRISAKTVDAHKANGIPQALKPAAFDFTDATRGNHDNEETERVARRRAGGRRVRAGRADRAEGQARKRGGRT